MTPPKSGNDWAKWQEHVLAELRRYQSWMESLAGGQQRLREEIATLKVKAGIWGLIGACIPVGLMLAVAVLRGH